VLISAVILSYNSAPQLQKCLKDLIRSLAAFETDNEILVVDNGSRDGSVELLEKYCDKYPRLVQPTFLPRNTGTTASRNRALKQASGEYVLVLDSDAYVNHQALKTLIDYLRSDARSGMAVPRLFYGNGDFQLSCDVFPTLLQKFVRFLFLKRIEAQSHNLQKISEPVAVDYAISACWMIPRSALSRVGHFDEAIFYSPEDVDYCIRVWEKGLRVMYVPDAEVIHDAQELSRGFRLAKFHFSHLQGLMYLFRKHRYFWSLKRLYTRVNRFG